MSQSWNKLKNFHRTNPRLPKLNDAIFVYLRIYIYIFTESSSWRESRWTVAFTISKPTLAFTNPLPSVLTDRLPIATIGMSFHTAFENDRIRRQA